MNSCPACQGLPEILPCRGYCINVMKGCLAFHAELSDSWNKFIDHLGLLADRLIGPFDIEAVVDPIGVKISDAIMNFQNSGYEVTGKVFEDCGRPRLQKRQVNSYGYAYGSSSRSRGNYRKNNKDKDEDTQMKKLIREIRSSLNDTREFWTKLPYALCKDNQDEASKVRGGYARSRYDRQFFRNEDQCWNGHDAGRYTNAIVSDGLMNQDRNPEVRVDISRPDVDINEQILALKLITKKLESAHNGHDVEWPSTSNLQEPYVETEGSGAAGCYDDEDCYQDEYNYYYEGSGSGEDTDEKPQQPAKVSPQKEELDVDEDENWPPWVTAKPEDSNDIVMVDEQQKPQVSSNSNSQNTPISRPSFNKSHKSVVTQTVKIPRL